MPKLAKCKHPETVKVICLRLLLKPWRSARQYYSTGVGERTEKLSEKVKKSATFCHLFENGGWRRTQGVWLGFARQRAHHWRAQNSPCDQQREYWRSDDKTGDKARWVWFNITVWQSPTSWSYMYQTVSLPDPLATHAEGREGLAREIIPNTVF